MYEKLEKQASKKNVLDKQVRKERILSLNATGASYQRIADILGVSKSTVYANVAEMRAEAIESIESIIESIPYEWKKAVEALDTLLRRTNDLLDSDKLEIGDRLSAIKLASELAERRLNLHTAPQIMQRAIQHEQKLRKKIEALQKTQSPYQVLTEVQQSAGKPAIITRTLKRVTGKKGKEEDLLRPVV